MHDESVAVEMPLKAAEPSGPVRETTETRQHFVLARLGSSLCALPLGAVIETLRPVPLLAVQGMPPFVLGLGVLRGQAVPVIDARILLGLDASTPPLRLVSVRVGHRQVALAVGEVLGVRELADVAASELPPLLAHAEAQPLQGLHVLGGELLHVLACARLLSADAWRLIDQGGGGQT